MASSAPYEQAWAACCDAVGCADALRAQGWQALAALQLDKDTLNEAQVHYGPGPRRRVGRALAHTGLGARLRPAPPPALAPRRSSPLPSLRRRQMQSTGR